MQYIRQRRKALYTELLTSGKLNDYLADLNEQAEDMFFRLVKEYADKQGVTEQLKVVSGLFLFYTATNWLYQKVFL